MTPQFKVKYALYGGKVFMRVIPEDGQDDYRLVYGRVLAIWLGGTLQILIFFIAQATKPTSHIICMLFTTQDLTRAGKH